MEKVSQSMQVPLNSTYKHGIFNKDAVFPSKFREVHQEWNAPNLLEDLNRQAWRQGRSFQEKL